MARTAPTSTLILQGLGVSRSTKQDHAHKRDGSTAWAGHWQAAFRLCSRTRRLGWARCANLCAPLCAVAVMSEERIEKIDHKSFTSACAPLRAMAGDDEGVELSAEAAILNKASAVPFLYWRR